MNNKAINEFGFRRIFNKDFLKSRWIVAKYIFTKARRGEVNISKAAIHRDWKKNCFIIYTRSDLNKIRQFDGPNIAKV